VTAAPVPQLCGCGAAIKAVGIADSDDGVELLGRRFDPYPHRTPGMASERQVTAVEDAGLFAAVGVAPAAT
jgi:hypothetical protein